MKTFNPCQPMMDRIEELLTTMDLHAQCMEAIMDNKEFDALFGKLSEQHDVLRNELEELVTIARKMEELETLSN